MSSVRVLVGTRKGAFILSSDGKRQNWQVDGPHFGGWEIFHLKGSVVDPNRIYASQASDWFGQVMHRSDDGGKTWQTVGNQFQYRGEVGSHQWFDGSIKPWAFRRVWHLEPSLADADTVFAGVEDAALFGRRVDLGGTERSAPAWHGGRLASRRGWFVFAHHSARPAQPPADIHRHFGGWRVPQ